MAIRVAVVGLAGPDRDALAAQLRRRFQGRVEAHFTWWAHPDEARLPEGTFDALVLDVGGFPSPEELLPLLREANVPVKVVGAGAPPRGPVLALLAEADGAVVGFGMASTIMAVGGILGRLEPKEP